MPLLLLNLLSFSSDIVLFIDPAIRGIFFPFGDEMGNVLPLVAIVCHVIRFLIQRSLCLFDAALFLHILERDHLTAQVLVMAASQASETSDSVRHMSVGIDVAQRVVCDPSREVSFNRHSADRRWVESLALLDAV